MTTEVNLMTVSNPGGSTYTYDKDRYSDPTRSDGRRAEGKKKGWQIATMYERHHEIARRIVLGEKDCDIARELGITASTVSSVKNSPIVQDKLAIMRAVRDTEAIDLAKEIAALAPLALERIKEAINTGTVNGKEVSAVSILKESNALLDRHMGKAVQRTDNRTVSTTLSLEDIERIKSKARSLREA